MLPPRAMHRAAFRNDHFGEVMGKNRFVTLMGALRFVAPDTMKEHSDWAGKPRPTDLMYKKTYKVDPVLDSVMEACRACYIMPMNVSLDEQTVGCRCEWCSVASPDGLVLPYVVPALHMLPHTHRPLHVKHASDTPLYVVSLEQAGPRW